MSDFETLGLKAGVWSGLLRRETPPRRILLAHMGQPVGKAELHENGDGSWRIDARLPPDRLSDGVQSFALLGDDENDATAPPAVGAERLGQLSVIAGQPLDMDLRAEIDLMRAELDLVKRELRRLASGG